MACSEAIHAALRMRPDLLDATTLLGLQDCGPGMDPLVLVNCRHCRSTLGLQIRAAEAADLWVRSRCRPGYVLTAADDRELEAVRQWVPGALARHGLHLDQVPGIGWRVCSTGMRRTPTAPRCLKCGGDARACDCPALALIS